MRLSAQKRSGYACGRGGRGDVQPKGVLETAMPTNQQTGVTRITSVASQSTAHYTSCFLVAMGASSDVSR
jgi:hypothetical protein